MNDDLADTPSIHPTLPITRRVLAYGHLMSPLLRHGARRGPPLISLQVQGQGPSSSKVTLDLRGGPRGHGARRTLAVLASSSFPQTTLSPPLLFPAKPPMSAGVAARRPHSGQAGSKGKEPATHEHEHDHEHATHSHSHSHSHSHPTSFLGGLTHTHGPGEEGHGHEAEQIVEALQKGAGTSVAYVCPRGQLPDD